MSKSKSGDGPPRIISVDENQALKVSLQTTTFRVEGGSNIFKSKTIKCFTIFYFHWIQHIHKLDEEIFYHLSKLWALSGVITFFHPILFVWNHQIVPQVMTVLSLTLLHIVPLVSLTYLNYAIFCAIRWTLIIAIIVITIITPSSWLPSLSLW